MVGPSGSGKTFITTGLIEGLSQEKFINNIVNFSARTSVNYTQGKLCLSIHLAKVSSSSFFDQLFNDYLCIRQTCFVLDVSMNSFNLTTM